MKKVRCIDEGPGNYIHNGQVYEVVKENRYHYIINTAPHGPGSFSKNRFEDVVETPIMVECINDVGTFGEITKGETYQVVQEDDDEYLLKGFKHFWLKNRFKVVEVPASPPTNTTPVTVVPPTATQPEAPPFDFNSYNGIRR